MRIAHVRSHVAIIFRIPARRRNVAIAVGARLRHVAGFVGIELAAGLILIGLTARLIGPALILVVAGLAVRPEIFRVGGFDLRLGLGEFVLQLDIRRVALVLIVLVVLRGAVAALVLARVVSAAALARTGV